MSRFSTTLSEFTILNYAIVLIALSLSGVMWQFVPYLFMHAAERSAHHCLEEWSHLFLENDLVDASIIFQMKTLWHEKDKEASQIVIVCCCL